jgi:hypothetical protein
MSKFGFGQPTGIDLTGEIGGILPSPEFKRKSRKEPGTRAIRSTSHRPGRLEGHPAAAGARARRLADGSCASRTW